jgi:hypothetical protein
MYGLLIESFIETIKTRYGERVWHEVKKAAKIDQEFFNTHQQYSEATLQKIIRCLTNITSNLFKTFKNLNYFLRLF